MTLSALRGHRCPDGQKITALRQGVVKDSGWGL